MRPLRFHLAGMMTVVAALALNLGVIRLLHGGTEEQLVYSALPMANLLAAVAMAAIYRPRLRGFAVGFIVAGTLSLVTFMAWIDAHPWTFVRYVDPWFEAIDQLVGATFPGARIAIVIAIFTAAFAVPHAAIGLAAGCVTARISALVGGPKHAEA